MLAKLTPRKKIHLRIRKKVAGTAERPRLTVFRSNKNISCQLIDDLSGTTLLSASSTKMQISEDKSAVAKAVGRQLAEQALQMNIQNVVFDRSGYVYHGRIKSLADGAREGGLKF
ncbi:MAG: 50S ribosomal protein L18 [Bacteroidota bacterium]